MAQITYANKVALNENAEIAEINKVTDDNMNEIKSVVNTNDNNVGSLANLTTTDKSSIVNAINELDANFDNYTTTSDLTTLLSQKQDVISSSNMLDADLVNDSTSTNKFVTSTDISNWNAKYDKPATGIPSSDMSSEVQTSLGKADTAIQSADLVNYELISNKVTSISSSSTDTQYPSAKCVYDIVGDIGTALDTINGEVI